MTYGKAAICVDGEKLENVTNFVYLGAQIEANAKTSPEINRRLAIASSKLSKMNCLWKNENIRTKMKILKTCIFPVAIYGCEAWTITKNDEKKIDAFEMKCYRKILRIPWTAKETNESIRAELNIKELHLMKTIRRLKLKYFGHIKRHDDTLEKLMMEGMMEGKRGR